MSRIEMHYSLIAFYLVIPLRLMLAFGIIKIEKVHLGNFATFTIQTHCNGLLLFEVEYENFKDASS